VSQEETEASGKPAKPTAETLAVLYDEIAQALSAQQASVDGLNERAQQLFSFAAVILTILAGLAPAQSSTTGKVLDLIGVPLFVVAAYFSGRAWEFQKWRTDPDATALWENYRLKSDEYLRHQVIQNRLQSLELNGKKLSTKLGRVKMARLWLYAGFIYVVALLFYRVLAPDHAAQLPHCIGVVLSCG